MRLKNILLLTILCAGIILPASGKPKKDAADLLKSTVWKLYKYKDTGSEMSEAVELAIETGNFFMKLTDTEMFVIHHSETDEDLDVDIYQYYLSDSNDKEFDTQKVGQTKNGRYLITGYLFIPEGFPENAYYVTNAEYISTLRNKKLSLKSYTYETQPKEMVSHLKPCNGEETELVNKIYLDKRP